MHNIEANIHLCVIIDRDPGKNNSIMDFLTVYYYGKTSCELFRSNVTSGGTTEREVHTLTFSLSMRSYNREPDVTDYAR